MRMLNGRLYRVAFLPFLIALGVAAFSLGSRPLPLVSSLTSEAFEGQRAFAELRNLATSYPDRRPGSPGDDALAAHIAHTIEGFSSVAGAGFKVRTVQVEGQTIEGERPLRTVIAARPGSTDQAPIVIVAHRDAAAPGSWAQLSGTAALIELARVFSARETKRAIVLVSTSGGSGGYAGAAQLSSYVPGPLDAAIVLGDLAGARARRPFVIPYSDGMGSAPLQLQRTVEDAITQQTGTSPGSPTALGQLAHLAFPLAAGEQAVLDASGVPSVLVQVSGERGPAAREPISQERLGAFGRAVLSAVDALDNSPDVSQSMQSGVLLQRKTVPAWALQLLLATLLLPPLITAADGLARARRRKLAAGRWCLWTLTCALPFMACAVFAYLLGALGILGATPQGAILPAELPGSGSAVGTIVALVLLLVLGWLLWAQLVRRIGWGTRPDQIVAGLSIVLVLLAVSMVALVLNPFSLLLVLPALHLWLLLAYPELRPRRLGSIALVLAGLLPLGLLIAFYARELGLGVGEVAWTGVMLVAGGQIGFGGAMLWSAGFGCAAAAALLALGSRAPLPGTQATADVRVSIRGPISYAGPGSLGGTESALRR